MLKVGWSSAGSPMQANADVSQKRGGNQLSRR